MFVHGYFRYPILKTDSDRRELIDTEQLTLSARCFDSSAVSRLTALTTRLLFGLDHLICARAVDGEHSFRVTGKL